MSEPGRALESAVTGLPIIATVPLRADIARAVDAGVFADRLPEPLATAAQEILPAVLSDAGKEVA